MCCQQPQQPSDVLCLGRLLLLNCTDREWPGRRHFQLDWRTATVLTVAVQRTMAARVLGRTAYNAPQPSPTKSASAVVRRSRTSSRARATADLRAKLQQRSALCRARLADIRTAAKRSNRHRSTRPAWKLPNFFVYPLGIPGRRSYDGGLSFSAKIQIAAEDGV